MPTIGQSDPAQDEGAARRACELERGSQALVVHCPTEAVELALPAGAWRIEHGSDDQLFGASLSLGGAEIIVTLLERPLDGAFDADRELAALYERTATVTRNAQLTQGVLRVARPTSSPSPIAVWEVSGPPLHRLQARNFHYWALGHRAGSLFTLHASWTGRAVDYTPEIDELLLAIAARLRVLAQQ